MYEAHFGLSGPAFQLNPDPTFYFESKGHSNALAYLKYGAYQGEGFIVVTGEIGAGKTTLVRTLLEGIDPGQVVAAQVVSTQLESGELLRAIATAFGVGVSGAGKAQLIASLEAFFVSLATEGRRALLIVDEAQNLDLEGIEELRMLSNFQLGKQALLQSFLVGQPELRSLLESSAMEQFRQRVIASCHLGPLTPAETCNYVVHRLKRVGWQDRPQFDPQALEAIHGRTAGIPRRINLLCNRLLLRAFLNGSDRIDVEAVDETSEELREEVGTAAFQAPTVRSPTPARGEHEQPRSGAARVPLTDAQASVWELHTEMALLQRSIACVVETPSQLLKAMALAAQIARDDRLPPLLAVNPGTPDQVALDGHLRAELPAMSLVHLCVPAAGRYSERASQALLTFDEVWREVGPCAVLAFGAEDLSMQGCLVAAKTGIPIVKLEGGRRAADARTGEGAHHAVMDQLADYVYTSKLTAHYTLYREGIPAHRVLCVGDLMENVVRLFAPAAEKACARVPALAGLKTGKPLLVVTMDVGGYARAAAEIAPLLPVLRAYAKKASIVWSMTPAGLRAVTQGGLDRRLRDSGVVLLPDASYLERLGLLQRAFCLVGDFGGPLQDEAGALGVPIVTWMPFGGVGPGFTPDGLPITVVKEPQQLSRWLGEALSAWGRTEDEPAYWDGGAAGRISEHLRGWLSARAGAQSAAPSASLRDRTQGF